MKLKNFHVRIIRLYTKYPIGNETDKSSSPRIIFGNTPEPFDLYSGEEPGFKLLPCNVTHQTVMTIPPKCQMGEGENIMTPNEDDFLLF